MPTGELSLASIAACDKTPILPPNLIIQWIEVRWTGASLVMKSRQYDLLKTISTSIKI